jgi:hypothetical protein
MPDIGKRFVSIRSQMTLFVGPVHSAALSVVPSLNAWQMRYSLLTFENVMAGD